jgi:exopolyphosphatase/guanosine-5'-triphosphate,3'-diphosphate pyrophosphatase
MRVASIDIGTNTFRILVAELRGNELKKLYIDRVITRLGGGFKEKEKLITEGATERALSALRRFAEILEEYRVEKIRAVATSVVRDSLNGLEFVEKVKKETGIVVEIISGEEEAKLTVDGVLRSVSSPSDYSVIFDVGGGSTEYVYVRRDTILGLRSTSMGVVHLAERFMKSDIPSESDIKMLCEEIENVLSYELSWIDISDDNLSLIGTAGTPTTLAAIELGLDKYNPGLINGFVLQKDMVLRILKSLASIPSNERLKIKGLEKGREDVIIPGALIVLKTMNRFSKDEVLVSDGGLLEGLAYSVIL